MIRSTTAGVEIDVRVVVRARRTGFGGVRDNAILIRLAAPPVEGAANGALVTFLADAFKVPKRAVRIVAGEQNRHKRVAIDGVSADAVRSLIL